MQAQEGEAEKPLSPNYLYNVERKPAWVAATGPLRFHNQDDPEVPQVGGMATFTALFSPQLRFVENLHDFWSHEDVEQLTAVLHRANLKSTIKIKDSAHKFEDTLQVPEFSMLSPSYSTS